MPLLSNITLDELQAGLSCQRLSSEDLVRVYLKRIEEINPKLNAIVEIDPGAVDAAKQLDKERTAGHVRGILHGVPLVFKNQYSTTGNHNTAGFSGLVGARTGRDSSVVKRLRDAGVIVLGKTNMTQWGNHRDPDAGNGWSADGDPWGSSSGSAVATAVGLSFAALGTEVEGNIICPAERSNLVGIKPTVGLVSRDLVIISRRLGTPSPLARCVKDAASILSVMAGPCENDSATADIPYKTIPDFAKSCRPDGLRNARIGIPRNALKGSACATVTPVVYAAFEQSFAILEHCGATIVDDTDFVDFEKAITSKTPAVVKLADFKADVMAYLRELKENPNYIHNMADIIEYTKHHTLEQYPLRGIAALESAMMAPDDRESEEFKAAAAYMRYLGEEGGVKGAMDLHNLDALMLPSCVSPIIPALCGYPIITVPLGFYPASTPIEKNKRGDLTVIAPNLPFGISFIGRPFSEEKLIAYAYTFETQTSFRNGGVPYITPSTELSAVVKSDIPN